jgi:hypothetical protein
MVKSGSPYHQSTTDLLSPRVLESLKAGIRLPETRFANLTMASKGQRSVYGGIFKTDDNVSEQTVKGAAGASSDTA